MEYLLGIDAGGSVVKAAIYDRLGNEVISHGEKLEILYPEKDHTERDMYAFREKLYRAVRKTIASSKIPPEQIAAIGLTGQANGLYLLDERGEPVQNAILSSDMRAKDYVRRWTEDGTLEQILPVTRQLLWAGQTSALVAWFADHAPEVLNRSAAFLTAKEYVRYLLTGALCMERTEASSMSLMDLDSGRLSERVAARLGIGQYLSKFPEKLSESTRICAAVTREAAAQTLLREGTPVVGGLIDTVASVISTGIVDESKLCIIVGTWGINAFLSTKPIASKKLFSAFGYCLPGYNLILEGSSTSASNLDWYVEKVMGITVRQADELLSDVEYRDSVLFLPFLYGTNAHLDAKAAFIGLKGQHDRLSMLRAVYEGIVFCHAYHIERLCAFCEMPSTVRMSGGGARSAVWMQLFADILGVTVEVSRARELGAMGAAIAAGVGVGFYPDMKCAAEQFSSIDAVYLPDANRHGFYREKYAVYKALLEALDPVWERLDRLHP